MERWKPRKGWEVADISKAQQQNVFLLTTLPFDLYNKLLCEIRFVPGLIRSTSILSPYLSGFSLSVFGCALWMYLAECDLCSVTSVFVIFWSCSVAFLLNLISVPIYMLYTIYSLIENQYCNDQLLNRYFLTSDPLGTMQCSLQNPGVIPIHNVGCNSQTKLFIHGLVIGNKHFHSQSSWKRTLVSCAKTVEPINTAKSERGWFCFSN